MTLHLTARHTILALGVALVWAAGVYAQGGSPEARALKNPEAATPESIAAGLELYQLNCQFCHGPKGLGDGQIAPPDTPNLTDDQWKHGSTDGEIFTVIKKGSPSVTTMPAHEERLTDTEIWHLVNYLRSIGPKP